jgi:hypothetical protein
MNADRRSFLVGTLFGIVLGFAGALAAWMKQWFPFTAVNPAKSTLVPTATFAVKIQGLAIVERSGSSVNINLVDPSKMSMPVHVPYLSAPKSQVNPSKCSPNPPPTDPLDSGRYAFDLTSISTLTMDSGSNAPADLDSDDGDIDDKLPPTGNSHWSSTKYLARLKTIAKATAISDRTKLFKAVLTLTHGHLHCVSPESYVGRNYVWTFTRHFTDGKADEQTAKQAMSDTLECSVPVVGSSVTFRADGNVLVVDAAGEALIRNLPSAAAICQPTSSPPPACVDHLTMLYMVTDAPTPYPVGVGVIDPNGPPSDPGLLPDYCPPGSI